MMTHKGISHHAPAIAARTVAQRFRDLPAFRISDGWPPVYERGLAEKIECDRKAA